MVIGDICVVVGTYTYPFECQLPVEIPSSLVAENGSITYSANLILDRPSWQIPTPDFPFTVVKPFDLSTDFTTQVRDIIDSVHFGLSFIANVSHSPIHTHRNRCIRLSIKNSMFAV